MILWTDDEIGPCYLTYITATPNNSGMCKSVYIVSFSIWCVVSGSDPRQVGENGASNAWIDSLWRSKVLP